MLNRQLVSRTILGLVGVFQHTVKKTRNLPKIFLVSKMWALFS